MLSSSGPIQYTEADEPNLTLQLEYGKLKHGNSNIKAALTQAWQ